MKSTAGVILHYIMQVFKAKLVLQLIPSKPLCLTIPSASKSEKQGCKPSCFSFFVNFFFICLRSVLRQCKNVELSFSDVACKTDLLKGTKKGTIYLTPYRVTQFVQLRYFRCCFGLLA